MIKLYTTWLGGFVVENEEGNYNLIDDNLDLIAITKEEMKAELKKVRSINVINRPAIYFIFENLLEKNNHGITVDVFKFENIDKLKKAFNRQGQEVKNG